MIFASKPRQCVGWRPHPLSLLSFENIFFSQKYACIFCIVYQFYEVPFRFLLAQTRDTFGTSFKLILTLQDKIKTARQDLFFLAVFPILFTVFNICYWSVHLSAQSTLVPYPLESEGVAPHTTPAPHYDRSHSFLPHLIVGLFMTFSAGNTTVCTCKT